MTAPETDWFALADRENAQAACVGHIEPRDAEQAEAWAELQRGDLRAIQRRLARLVGAVPARVTAIPGSTNTDTE